MSTERKVRQMRSPGGMAAGHLLATSYCLMFDLM